MKMLLVTARELEVSCQSLPQVEHAPRNGCRRITLPRHHIRYVALGLDTPITHYLDFVTNWHSQPEPFWELQTSVFILSESDMSKHLKDGDHYFEPEGGRFWP